LTQAPYHAQKENPRWVRLINLFKVLAGVTTFAGKVVVVALGVVVVVVALGVYYCRGRCGRLGRRLHGVCRIILGIGVRL